MDKARIAAIYQQLHEAVIPMDPALERGPQYLRDLLAACRRMQDWAAQVTVEAKQHRAKAKQQVRAAKAVVTLSVGSADLGAARVALAKAEDEYDDLTALEQAINVVRANLKTTDSGIRLQATLLEAQIRLGQVTPPPPSPEMTVTPPPAEPLEAIETAPASVSADALGDDDLARLFEEPRTPPSSGSVEVTGDDIERFLKG